MNANEYAIKESQNIWVNFKKRHRCPRESEEGGGGTEPPPPSFESANTLIENNNENWLFYIPLLGRKVAAKS
jgi:hypothetical protein